MVQPVTFVGEKELRRKLIMLEQVTSKKAIRAGVNAALTPVVRAIRSEVNGTSASSEAKRAARKTVGKNLATSKGQIAVAKAGFGVGKTSKARSRALGRRLNNRKSKRGVGIDSPNIHWLVFGVGDEGSSPKRVKRVQKKSGRETGTFRGLFLGVVASASLSAASASLNAARQKIWQITKRDATRKV